MKWGNERGSWLIKEPSCRIDKGKEANVTFEILLRESVESWALCDSEEMKVRDAHLSVVGCIIGIQANLISDIIPDIWLRVVCHTDLDCCAVFLSVWLLEVVAIVSAVASRALFAWSESPCLIHGYKWVGSSHSADCCAYYHVGKIEGLILCIDIRFNAGQVKLNNATLNLRDTLTYLSTGLQVLVCERIILTVIWN